MMMIELHIIKKLIAKSWILKGKKHIHCGEVSSESLQIEKILDPFINENNIFARVWN